MFALVYGNRPEDLNIASDAIPFSNIKVFGIAEHPSPQAEEIGTGDDTGIPKIRTSGDVNAADKF